MCMGNKIPQIARCIVPWKGVIINPITTSLIELHIL